MANEVTVPLLPCAPTARRSRIRTSRFAARTACQVREGPVQGIPRMTRPRRRKNSGNLSGFTVVDPGGNWIRIFPAARTSDAPATERVEALAYRAELARSMDDAAHAEAALAELRAIPLTAEERVVVADTLAAIDDLR
jgi:hypothetical protein